MLLQCITENAISARKTNYKILEHFGTFIYSACIRWINYLYPYEYLYVHLYAISFEIYINIRLILICATKDDSNYTFQLVKLSTYIFLLKFI